MLTALLTPLLPAHTMSHKDLPNKMLFRAAMPVTPPICMLTSARAN